MVAVLTCIIAQHDLRLVAVAALICVIACVSAFGFQVRVQTSQGGLRWAWLALTAMVAGSGVWATHFLAMLAYQPSLKIAYDLSETLASLSAAVVGMGLGFALLAWRGPKGSDLIGGALTGASVAVMHYMGMDAVRTTALVSWDVRYVAASLVVTAVGGMAAFALSRRVPGRWGWAASAGALVAGIVGLHFTGMTAVILLPDPDIHLAGEVMDRGGLALLTSGLAALILGAGISLGVMERLGRQSTFASLRQGLNAVPAGLVFYDSRDCVLAWNEAYAKLMAECGVTVEAGSPRARYVDAAARAGWASAPTAEGDHWSIDIQHHDRVGGRDFVLPDGRRLRLEVCRNADHVGVTVMTDVTAEWRTAQAMAAARDAAEAANRAKSEFLANISHEIRTPLNGVLGIAEVLQRTALDDEQRKLVAVIQKSGGLLNGLLTDILDLARVEAGAFELRPQRVTLGELVRGVGDLYGPAAAEKGLSLTVTLHPDAEGEVECDPQRLAQVLGNLVSNAVKFTDIGGVSLSAAREGGRVRFSVRDTGIGFDEAERELLLQRFRQADSSATRNHGGAGLGLTLCEAYLRQMGSALECRSTPGRGSLFGFALDLPPLAPQATDAGAAAGKSDLDRFNVLVVDDNPVNRQVMELILGSVGVPCASVENGQEALDAMMSGDFDAVLMDIQMPVMDGLEATRRIRQWEHETHRGHAPIVIVSANGLPEHVDAGRAAGADAHLNKPVSAAALLAELEQQRTAFARRAAA